MITIMPASLTPYNIPALAERTELVQPVTQIGRLSTAENKVFSLRDERLSDPAFLSVLEQACAEGYAIAIVVGGGRDLHERQASGVWAFVPSVKLRKVSVDQLIEDGKIEQRLTTSHSAPVDPTRRGMERFKGRPGAAPSIKMITPGGDDEEVADATEEEA